MKCEKVQEIENAEEKSMNRIFVYVYSFEVCYDKDNRGVANMIVFKRERYRIELDESKGEITSLTNGTKEFICEKMPLFLLQMREHNGDIIQINSYDAKKISLVQKESELFVSFSGFRQVNLNLTISFQFDEMISVMIKAENHTPMIIEWIEVLPITVPNDLNDSGGKSKILWGCNEGVVIDDLSLREAGFGYIEPKYPSEGLMGIFPAVVETQFMAYYDLENGLYIGTHDRNGSVKGIDFYRCGAGIKLQFRLFTGLFAGQDFVMNYPLVIQMFQGNWESAAEIYRNWFENTADTPLIDIKKNKQLPNWYSESPIIVTYPVRGQTDTDLMNPNKLFPYLNAMKHIDRLAEETESKIMVLLMHWEGTAPWAPPYVWPPYGGQDVFQEFADALHQSGHLLGVYCSGLGFTMKSNLVPDYDKSATFAQENLSAVMCLSPEGDLPFSKICTAQRSGYDMCPSCEFTVDTVVEEIQKITSCGIDYIQVLDQNHGGTPYFCYSKDHSHPPVPGKWQVEAMIGLLKKLIEAIGKKKVLLGCESAAAEPYIPYLQLNDNRYHLNYHIGKPVPLYAYLYHKYINNFMGNQVGMSSIFDHKKCPNNLLMRMAYAFIAGDMLTFVINDEGVITWNWGCNPTEESPSQKDSIGFAKQLNAWRRERGKKYLYNGKMIKPFEVNGFGENYFYKKNQFHLTLPALFTSRWCADDGMTGQFIVNYNMHAIDCVVHLQKNIPFKVYQNNVLLLQGEQERIELKIPALTSIMIEVFGCDNL